MKAGGLLLVVVLVCYVVHGPLLAERLVDIQGDHSHELCACCNDLSSACLTNVGKGAKLVGPSNLTNQHYLFETMQRDLNGEKCVVEGTIPAWAAGSLYKNGFGQYESKKSNYRFLSVFDAMGYTMRAKITKQNEVFMYAKMTRNDWYNRSEGEGEYAGRAHVPPYRSFMGTEPELTFMGRLRLMFTIVPDNLNVNLVRQGKHLFGISDMDGFNEVDRHNLDYITYFRYSDSLSMTTSVFSFFGMMTSAHPSVVASSPHIVYQFIAYPGMRAFQLMFYLVLATPIALYFYQTSSTVTALKNRSEARYLSNPSGLKILVMFLSFAFCQRLTFLAMDGELPGWNINMYTLYTLDTSKEPLTRVPLVSWSTGKLTYLHEFAQTENYIVFVEWPACWNIQSIASPLFNDNSKLLLTWNPELGTKITVIDKKKGVIVSTHKTEPYWSYHHIGAYESAEGIVIDACTFDSAEHLNTFELRTLSKNSYKIPRNVNRRFLVPLPGGDQEQKVKVINVGPIGFDLPSRNLEKAGVRYDFAYGTGYRYEGEWWNSIVKVNMNNGKTIQWFEEHVWPSQPVFVKNPATKEEDDGLLIVLNLDALRKQSYLLFLDAKDFKEVARAWIPIMLPYTSHGYFDVADDNGNANQSIVPGFKNGWKPSL